MIARIHQNHDWRQVLHCNHPRQLSHLPSEGSAVRTPLGSAQSIVAVDRKDYDSLWHGFDEQAGGNDANGNTPD
jgi:hypothetical protein